MSVDLTLNAAIRGFVPVFAAALLAAPVAAQEFPRQMRIIVASAGGTGPDFIARLIAPRLGESLRNSVIVENRTSTNGIMKSCKTPTSGVD